MDRDTYFAVQYLYNGWALSSIAIIAAALIGLGLVKFFICVYPANTETENWTVKVPNWAFLRAQWEFGHVAIAALTFFAFIAISQRIVRIKHAE